MIILTGGAGFIGSAMVWELNQQGYRDIVVVDNLASTNKWRNLVGLAKSLPEAEMQALLLANIAVPDTAMHDLALARAVAVRDYLLERRMPPERLFLGAVRLSSGQEGWTPRAELGLGMR